MGWSGREGKREARKNREASRHERGREKRERKKNTQMERPELVAATDPPTPTKLETQKPRAQGAEHASCSLDQGSIGWSSSEHREEAERACQGPRMRDG